MYNIRIKKLIIFYFLFTLNLQSKEVTSKTITLKYFKSSYDFKKIRKIWTKIVGKKNLKNQFISTHNNQVFVKGHKKEINFFEQILKELDQKKQRVSLNVKILQSKNLYNYAFGIDYSAIYNRENTIKATNDNFGFAGLGSNITDIPTPTGSANPFTIGNLLVLPINWNIQTFENIELLGGIPPNVQIPIVFGGTDLNRRRLNMLINALDYEEKTEILTDENILTTDNKVYKILKGQSYPFYEQDIEIENQNVVTTTKITFYDIGKSIQVKTEIVKNSQIQITLFSENYDFIAGNLTTNNKGIINSGILFDNYTVKSTFFVKNKEPIFLCMTTEEKKANHKVSVPKISQIPKIGNVLFASNEDYINKNNLFICLTPEIID